LDLRRAWIGWGRTLLVLGSEMAYFADLTKYTYLPNQAGPNVLNVGWLDQGVPYQRELVDSDVVEALLRLCKKPVNLTRGFHQCPFCRHVPHLPVSMTVDDQRVTLGNAEIRVSGENGIVYAAPTLVCHYIEKHEYRPPDGFLAAVGKLPGNMVEPKHRFTR
jgi:hypothetical protein